MGHEYNEMINILSESINLTDSIPMPREGLIEEFEPIFADDYFNNSGYHLRMNDDIADSSVMLDIEESQHRADRYQYRRNFRRTNPPTQENMFCSYPRSTSNNFIANRPSARVGLSNVVIQSQPVTNQVQIELSSDSGDDEDNVALYLNSNRKRRVDYICNKKFVNNSQRQSNQSQVDADQNGENLQIVQLETDESGEINSTQNRGNEHNCNDTNSEQNIGNSSAEIECDCSNCNNLNLTQNKRKDVDLNKLCKLNKKHCKRNASKDQTNRNEPIAGPSRISSNNSSVVHQTVDSSGSDEEDDRVTINHIPQSDVLTAPELQLDCFSDTSSESSNDVIAIEPSNSTTMPVAYNSLNRNNSNDTTPLRSSHFRNRGYENEGSQPNYHIRPLMSINTPVSQIDNNRCPYSNFYQFSQNQRNNYSTNHSRLYPDARAPNAPDFGRNNVFNSGSSNNNGQNIGNSPGQTRSFGRWLNRGDNHYRRRYYGNSPRTMTYVPHQRLWHQQHIVQEMYRRFMSNNFEDNNRYHYNHGLSVNYNPQSFSPHHWHRRGYPVYPTPHAGSYPSRLFNSGLPDEDFSSIYVSSIRRYANRGATQETIENNTLSYKFTPVNESFESEKCSICLSPFEVDSYVRRLPCMHFYHRECIEQWLQLNSTCPICRIDIQKSRKYNLACSKSRTEV
uniref:CSON007381 protein n=1 Tax=Culicoides sonorensis TaxID=179676 RepID=A0A336LJR9_CULSO